MTIVVGLCETCTHVVYIETHIQNAQGIPHSLSWPADVRRAEKT